MQTLFSTSRLLAAVIVLIAGTVSAEESSELLKESFEKGDATPENWKIDAQQRGVRLFYDKRQGHSGKRSLSLKKTLNRYFPIAQWERTISNPGTGSHLKVACQVRAKKVTKSILDIQFLNAEGGFISHEWACYIGAKEAGDAPVSHDWKAYSGQVEIPKETEQIQVALQIYGPGQVWFDDLELSIVETTEKKPAGASSLKPIDVKVNGSIGQYLFLPPKGSETSPASGNALLIVLPGGDGSADFHPFVKRIQENALGDDFAIAQPIAKKWSEDQGVVWPIASNRTTQTKYTTEELISAIIVHVSQETRIDPRRIYLLAWSSGGPAAYATLLQEKSDVKGGLIAMSVFKPEYATDLKHTKGRDFYLLHSPDDRVCPFWMAKSAQEALSKAGAKITLEEYAGGHGWRGNVFGNIRQGIDWLDQKSD